MTATPALDPPTESSAAPSRQPSGSVRTVRWLGTVLLAVVLAVTTATALAGAWARALIYDTDHYVATVAPLIEEPAVQEALTSQIVDQVVGTVDARLEELPEPIRELLAGAMTRFGELVDDTVTTVVASDEFAEAWEAANRSAHAQVAGSLTGQNDAVTVEDGTVAIETEVFVQAGKDGLAEVGLGQVADLLPDVNGSFVVLESRALPIVQAAVRVLDDVGRWMWVVAVLLAVALVLVAPRPRLGALAAAIGVAGGSLLLLAGTAVVRQAYLASTGILSTEAKAVIFARLAADLRSSTLTVLAVAVVVGLGVALTGVLRDRRRPA